MSERDDYPAGVPCWVDTLVPDPDRAVAFYTDLFGWEAEDRATPGSDPYYVCTLRGRDVAAIGTQPDKDLPPGWNTYVRVADVDASVAAARDAGGDLVLEPHDAPIGGRRAMLADPAKATIGIWQFGGHQGAQLVNEPSAWAMSILNTAAADADRFYGAVFGWSTSGFDMGGGAELTMWHRADYVGGEPSQPVPRDVVAVMTPLGDSDAAAAWTVNFWVRDADAVAEIAAAHGGSVISSPADRPPFREAVVADPDGAPIAVSQLTAG